MLTSEMDLIKGTNLLILASLCHLRATLIKRMVYELGRFWPVVMDCRFTCLSVKTFNGDTVSKMLKTRQSF